MSGDGRTSTVRRVGRGLRRAAAVSCVSVLMVAACGSSSNTALDAEEQVTSEPVTNEPVAGVALDEVVADFVGDGPGGVDVLLKRGGETTVSAAGSANAAGDPMTSGLVFRVGSISKPFVATMVLQLVDEGRVDLDDPLNQYLPDTSVGVEVTIRQLLSHRSGLPNYTDQPAFFTDVLADLTRQLSPGDILGYVADVQPGAAGESFAYSNTNYILLGQLIEQLDSTDLNSALNQRITEPTGLASTWFATPGEVGREELVGGWANGLLDGDPGAAYDGIASSAWAAGALVSTTDDLAAFLQALFDGSLISPGSLDQMIDTGPDGYGLGLFTVGLGLGQAGYGHNGGIPGYNATMGIDPDTGDIIVIVANSDVLVADQLAIQVLQL